MEQRSDDHEDQPGPGGVDGLGRRIAEEYAERPQTEAEAGWSDAATVAMIAEEPW